MAAADWRVAEEIRKYYRRAAHEANLYARQSVTLPPTSTPDLPTPTPTPTTTTTPPSSTSSSTSSTTETSTTETSTTSYSNTTPGTTPPSTTPPTTGPSSGPSSTVREPESISRLVSTTIITTDANGQIRTTVAVTATVVPGGGGNQSSTVNTGAIVGGVVGGVAFILTLVALVIWWRRRKRFDEFEANIFDPDLTVQRPMSTAADPHSDLLTTAAIPEAARNITPYSYGHQHTGSAGTGTGTAQGSSFGGPPEVNSYYAYDNPSSAAGAHYPPPMAGANAYRNSGYVPQSLIPGAMAAGVGAGAGASEAASLNRGQTVSSTASSYPQSSYSRPTSYQPPYGPPSSSPQFPQPRNQAMLTTPLNPRAAKEQEAFQHTHGQGGWAVTNQGVDSAGSGGSGVVVHQDRGRVNIPEGDEDARDAEIPPAYESIHQEDGSASAAPPSVPHAAGDQQG